jgi:hypothetical protein
MDNGPPTTHRISEFYKWDAEERLDLAPPFQRKPVWPLKNKSYLMDTIINGLPVPEIYMQVKTDVNGNTRYVVIDGQQRIRAILEFLKKEYALLEEDNKTFGGKTFPELPDGVKTDFWNYGLVVRELNTSKDVEVRGIFQRLNKNVIPLNHQELRHAIYGGKFHSLAYALTEDEYWDDQRIVTPSEVRRMLDVSFVSELIIGVMVGAHKRDEETIDKFYKDYDETFQQEDDVKAQFNRTRKIVEAILPELRPTRWSYKSEFYSLFVAISELLKEYHFPPERFSELKAKLTKFSVEVDNNQKVRDAGAISNASQQVKDFTETVIASTTLEEPRRRRDGIVRSLLISSLLPLDPKRDFTEEEKRIIWDSSPTKKCSMCGKAVALYEDYEPNHKIPHSKGGKTEIRNGEVTHRHCNRAKGAR